MLTDKQKIELIEVLCLHAVYVTNTTKQKVLDSIYKICHVRGNCDNPHEDWANEVEGLFESMKRYGEICEEMTLQHESR